MTELFLTFWRRRLDRLEGLVERLVTRLESTLDNVAPTVHEHQQHQEHYRRTPPLSDNGSGTGTGTGTGLAARHRESHPAPVFLIRDACTDAGVTSPGRLEPGAGKDVISTGLVPLSTARTLLSMYVYLAACSVA